MPEKDGVIVERVGETGEGMYTMKGEQDGPLAKVCLMPASGAAPTKRFALFSTALAAH